MTKLKTYAIDGFATRLVAAAVLTVGVALSHSSARADMVMPGTYILMDHPDGNYTTSGPPSVNYGLRLDDFCHGSATTSGLCDSGDSSSAEYKAERTFSVDPGVTLTWDGGTSATIAGIVRRNEDNSLWDVTYNITGITNMAGGPVDSNASWKAAAMDLGGYSNQGPNAIEGWLTGRADGDVDVSAFSLEVIGKNNMAGEGFLFKNDNHRCDYKPEPCWPAETIVPRGWIVVRDEWGKDIMPADTNDWLVVAKKQPDTTISEPGTMALFGLGLIGLGYARRRRLI